MANKTLFNTTPGRQLPAANTVNEAGGIAYRFEPRHALAQYAATGCLNDTFYAAAGAQLDTVLKLCQHVEPDFIARTALFARQRGHMKDLPALLCAVLTTRGPAGASMLAEVFDRVIDSPKMLRNFVQIIRSGKVGRKSLGSMPKRLVRQWLESRSDEQLFRGSVGNTPSLADIIKMVHPQPGSSQREALYGYLIGREFDQTNLPALVRDFEAYKKTPKDERSTQPDVPFQMLTSLELGSQEWKAIARRAPWQTTRMALNSFARHGVFKDKRVTRLIADRLRDAQQVARSRVLPYQLMVAHAMVSADVPRSIREALQDAMEIAMANVPTIEGKVYVLLDVSGSMHSPVTGYRKGSSSAVLCVHVAALIAAAILRKNPDAEVVPFHSRVEAARLNPRDTVMTNAKTLASLPSGGTDCSAPLHWLNKRKCTGDLVIFVSDNESWIDTVTRRHWWGSNPTAVLGEWSQFKQRSPKAKLVCIDLQPNSSTQAPERDDITNVGGFSDQVFELFADVAAGRSEPGYWVKQIEQMAL